MIIFIRTLKSKYKVSIDCHASVYELKELIQMYFDLSHTEQVIINNGKICCDSYKMILLNPTFLLFSRNTMYSSNTISYDTTHNYSSLQYEFDLNTLTFNVNTGTLQYTDTFAENINNEYIESANVNETNANNNNVNEADGSNNDINIVHNDITDTTTNNINNSSSDSSTVIETQNNGSNDVNTTLQNDTISIQDRESIERLVELGYPYHVASIAFIVGNRNENTAANLLFNLPS